MTIHEFGQKIKLYLGDMKDRIYGQEKGLKIKDDLYIHDDDEYYPVEKKQRYIFIMGSCYLEIINYISYNHVMIECGS